jgi:hypothetical protein
LSTNATGTLLWSTYETTSSITTTSSGAYTVTQSLSGCVSPTATINISVKLLPTPVITGSPNSSSSLLVGETNQYSTPLVAGDLYSWSASGEVGLCSNEKYCIVVHFVNPCCIYGVWTIYVTETNASTGCSATATKDVTVNP